MEQPDGRTRDIASAERRAIILRSTLGLLAERGLYNTKIADIARESGASIGSIYHHFGSREGVFYALYIETFELCFAELRAAVLPSTTAREGIRNLADTYLRWVEATPGAGDLHLRCVARRYPAQFSARDCGLQRSVLRGGFCVDAALYCGRRDHRSTAVGL